MTELLVAIAPLLCRSEMNALLLETTTYLESEKPEERTAKYHLALARLYHQLTLLQQDKPKQAEQWSANHCEPRRALAMKPNSQEIRSFFTQLDAQSSEEPIDRERHKMHLHNRQTFLHQAHLACLASRVGKNAGYELYSDAHLAFH